MSAPTFRHEFDPCHKVVSHGRGGGERLPLTRTGSGAETHELERFPFTRAISIPSMTRGSALARFRHSSLLPWTAVALVGALSAPATAAQRVALAIGNASYEHAPALANPLNDAADMDAALERLGFKVTRLENVDQASLRRGLQDFALAASASEVAGGVLRRTRHRGGPEELPGAGRCAACERPGCGVRGRAPGAGAARGGTRLGAAAGDIGCVP